jgi:hypothetical protein
VASTRQMGAAVVKALGQAREQPAAHR